MDEQPPVDVRHGLLVAQNIPYAVASQDQEAVCLRQLDRMYFRLRDNLLLVPQAVPLAWWVYLVVRDGRSFSTFDYPMELTSPEVAHVVGPTGCILLSPVPFEVTPRIISGTYRRKRHHFIL